MTPLTLRLPVRSRSLFPGRQPR